MLEIITQILYQLVLGFCFGSLNALMISLISSKGIQQGFLDSLFKPLKKSILLISVAGLILNIYLNGLGIITYLMMIYLVNTLIFSVYFGKRWSIPEPKQLIILQISSMTSLVLWYAIMTVNFL